MNIYHYNSFGVYTHTSKAQLNPKRVVKGKLDPQNDGNDYIIPNGATIEEPPKTKEGKIAVYQNGWKVIEDIPVSYTHVTLPRMA